MPLKVLFLTPYPYDEAPSQRFRFEQYFTLLSQNNIEFKQSSFLDKKTWEILYKPGNNLQKVLGISRGFLKRILLLFSIPKYDLIFIHREASPLGPPVFEWITAKVLRKKIIYDFDDAIWLPNTSAENSVAARLKCHWKVAKICKWSYKISAGNRFLAEFAKQFNSKVIVNPTTLDLEKIEREAVNTKKTENKRIVVGWTGSHSTLIYLNLLLPVFEELNENSNHLLMVISNKPPELPISNFQFIQWKKETEIEDLQKIDIGIMPLTEDDWSKGKCGFKALQYMALGIPALVSPVGVNKEIIEDGINGFFCSSSEEWLDKIILLIYNPDLRNKIGSEAKSTVEKKYSVASNSSNFLYLFQ